VRELGELQKGRAASTVSLLARTPRPFPTESLFGYVLRVAEQNGYHTPHYLMRLAQIAHHQQQAPSFAAEKFARILGFDAERLRPIAYQAHAGKSHQFKILDHPLGHGFNRGPLRLRAPAFCVRCVAQRGYIDAFWDLSVAIGCPEHRCQVLTHCPHCRSPLRGFRPGLLTCRCGASLSDAHTDALDTPTTELMGVLQAKLHRSPLAEVANSSGFPLPFLQEIPLWAMIQMLQALEVIGAEEWTGRAEEGSAHQQCAGVMGLRAAISALAEWPLGYERFLAKSGVRLINEDGPARLRTLFAQLHGGVFKYRVLHAYIRPLHEAFVQFGLGHSAAVAADPRPRRGVNGSSPACVAPKLPYAQWCAQLAQSFDRLATNQLATTQQLEAGTFRKARARRRLPMDALRGLIDGAPSRRNPAGA